MGELIAKAMSLKNKIAQAQQRLTFTKRHGWKAVWGLLILGGTIVGTYQYCYLELTKTKTVKFLIENTEVAQAYSGDNGSQDMGKSVSKQVAENADLHLDSVATGGSKNSPEDVIKLIDKIAKEENFTETENLKRLLFCESSLGRKKINYNQDTRKTIDRGTCMINSYWHSEVTDEQANDDSFCIRWTIKKIQSGGLSQWNCNAIYNDLSYKYE